MVSVTWRFHDRFSWRRSPKGRSLRDLSLVLLWKHTLIPLILSRFLLCPPPQHYQIRAYVSPYQRGFLMQQIANNTRTGQPAKHNTVEYSVLNGLHISLPCFRGLQIITEDEWKAFKASGHWGLQWNKTIFDKYKNTIYTWVHSSCKCLRVIHTRLSQREFQHTWALEPSSPKLRAKIQNDCREEENQF